MGCHVLIVKIYTPRSVEFADDVYAGISSGHFAECRISEDINAYSDRCVCGVDLKGDKHKIIQTTEVDDSHE